MDGGERRNVHVENVSKEPGFSKAGLKMMRKEGLMSKVEGINSQIRKGKINGDDLCIGSLHITNL